MRKVSIIMAVKDCEKYLYQSVDSILNQTYENFELFIVLNGSNPETIKIANSFTDKRIKILSTDICQLSFNLNLALNYSDGYYIARMDADDVSFPERLSCQVSCMEEGGYDVVGSSIQYIDEFGSSLGTKNFPSDNYSIRRRIFYSSVLSHPCLLFKRDILMDVSGYLGGRYAQDYDLYLRIMRNKDVVFYNIQTPLLKYRLHLCQSKGNYLSYAEVSGYLLKEFFYVKSIYCLFGSFVYFLKAALGFLRSKYLR